MNIKITTNDGKEKEIKFEDLLNISKYTVLYFYPKDDTPGCTLEAQDFSLLLNEFKKNNCQIVGVSKDSTKSHCNFIDKYGLQIQLISDYNLELHNKFETIGEKNLYGKIYKGTIRSTFLLDKYQKIIKERRNVKSKGHAKEVLEYLTSL